MWKILIADDEPKIRQGLKNTLEGFGLPLCVCAEAKNGIEALNKAKEFEPDILLVDICMPKLNGIEFLKELKKLSVEYRIIIISGFNEFAYAKQAIELGVSQYLLKPIAEEELRNALEGVMEELTQIHKSRRFMDMMRQQYLRNGNSLRSAFFNDWMDGKLLGKEWEEQKEILDIEIPDTVLLILAAAQSGFTETITGDFAPEEFCRHTLEKLIQDLTGEYKPVYVFMNRCQDVVGMIGGYQGEVKTFQQLLTEKIEKMTDRKCCVQLRTCRREDIPKVHEELRVQARKVLECRPIVMEARTYIYDHYQQRELDLTQVADAIGCNSSYLSRVMKQELGVSFKDFLTTLRINQAILLMRNDRLSLNQIAEQVGYNNQHYFSAAFKNCQGVSPSEFRRTMVQEE